MFGFPSSLSAHRSLAASVRGVAIALSVSACNELASIEGGVLVLNGQGGGMFDDAGADTTSTASSSGLGAQGGSGTDAALPPDVTIDSSPFIFSAKAVSHEGGLIAGRLDTVRSNLGVEVTPDCLVDATCFSELSGTEVCVSGSTEAVPNGDFVNYWGAQLHIRLQDGFSTPARSPWDRAGGRARGLSFRITGSPIEGLSFNAITPPIPGEMYPGYGVNLPSRLDTQHHILFESLASPVWAPTMVLPDDAPFTGFVWGVGAADNTAKTFDFCINDIRLILAAE
jgi:hypothetical protein